MQQSKKPSWAIIKHWKNSRNTAKVWLVKHLPMLANSQTRIFEKYRERSTRSDGRSVPNVREHSLANVSQCSRFCTINTANVRLIWLAEHSRVLANSQTRIFEKCSRAFDFLPTLANIRLANVREFFSDLDQFGNPSHWNTNTNGYRIPFYDRSMITSRSNFQQ